VQEFEGLCDSLLAKKIEEKQSLLDNEEKEIDSGTKDFEKMLDEMVKKQIDAINKNVEEEADKIFIEKELGEKYPAGDYIDKDGKILGKHKGMIHYTIGQRKGLGISMNKHVFVTAKDSVNNTVTLGDECELFSNRVIIKGINLIPFDKLTSGARFEAKVRYSQKQSPVYAEQTGEDEITLIFDTPQRAPAKGQSAVLYDGDYLVGGGIIV
jgi:tRNA-specific 2-thiouridylase